MPRNVGAYAKLLSTYAADDAIIAAGEAAELLFVRGLAFCSTADSDGYITEGQLARVVGAGMKDATKRASALVQHGLWVRTEGGYVVRSWLKMHESAEEKGRKRRTDRERKRAHPDDGIRAESERNPSGQESESEGKPDGVRVDSLDCGYLSSNGTTIQSSSVQSNGASSAPPDAFDAEIETIEQRTNRLTKTYCDRVKLSNFAAIRGVVRKAVNADYRDPDIVAALERLAADGRSVTTDSLRYELEGKPAPTNRKRTGDDKVRDGLALAERLAREQSTPRLSIGARP